MFIKVRFPWDVTIPAKDMDNGLVIHRAILMRVLDACVSNKATKDHGYFITIRKLESIGKGRIKENTGEILFPVVFSGVSFKMFKGEILYGVVRKVLKLGVVLKSGPCQNIYLSHLKMPGYKYIPGENPVFMNQNMSRIQYDTNVRFAVADTKWKEAEKDFIALASIEGGNLGPV